MTMTVAVSAKLDFLIGHHAEDTEHSKASLFEHLTGTRDLLLEWGADETLCDAGMFHSVYGTETFSTSIVPVALRAAVRALIGEDAERIAYYFCAMVKESLDANLDGRAEFSLVSRMSGATIPLSREDFVALCHVSLANWLEQRDRWEAGMQLYRADAFKKMLPFLNPGARAAVVEAYGDKPGGPDRRGSDNLRGTQSRDLIG